jgi:hypothetical protein
VHIQHLPQVAHPQPLPFANRQRLRRAHRVLDLPPIEVVLGEVRVVLLREGRRRRLFSRLECFCSRLDCSCSWLDCSCYCSLLKRSCALDEDFEDGASGLVV